jgi:hypothetical protein
MPTSPNLWWVSSEPLVQGTFLIFWDINLKILYLSLQYCQKHFVISIATKFVWFSFWCINFWNLKWAIRKRKANWTGHIFRRKCLLQWFIEGKIKGGIEVTGRRGRRRRKLLDELKERRGYSHLKDEALDRTMWRARFGRGFGPVVRQTTEWMMNEWISQWPLLWIVYFVGKGWAEEYVCIYI